jgi:hypothetical protein
VNTLPLMILRAYRLIPASTRGALLGRYVRGSTSHLALTAISEGGNGWAALWRYGRIIPGRSDGGFWGDWGT